MKTPNRCETVDHSTGGEGRKARKGQSKRMSAGVKAEARSQRREDRYNRYMRSAAWRRKRAEKLKEAGHVCNRCDQRFGLHVHHLTYARFGNEELEDLEVLCAKHHQEQHPEKFLNGGLNMAEVYRIQRKAARERLQDIMPPRPRPKPRKARSKPKAPKPRPSAPSAKTRRRKAKLRKRRIVAKAQRREAREEMIAARRRSAEYGKGFVPKAMRGANGKRKRSDFR